MTPGQKSEPEKGSNGTEDFTESSAADSSRQGIRELGSHFIWNQQVEKGKSEQGCRDFKLTRGGTVRVPEETKSGWRVNLK